ncbi:MAG: hypothetical protein A2W61_02885 [Deltaproteobacteria bacterium RIFCSPLOWO2_01_44_7]|nr:MAG: hypothetical protein A2712_07510 [Deltaproteobacteria bacterium RIFCSPHIGHO2_01_FULL_43_49]OGQ14810.1 MAG: hypothetical protein A3D22_09485 [Deltaproteobacteria bacterium RIFCSPHIGHO2_02_FULL_44_53]OGQ28196.1 MAG: hypothetical protein A3D98_08195 [Deltaproteobacteria bacterium RIFCSPHIGHO2_12_FULL_44_21]OGQ31408.1 MAG: hypothetical protein A2979_08245 [Deltaproteobacteria bacterium RIFCSPLOWO2_01_FULL_45_74]OGQ38408.1 MAG: hypothetical protein A2W61_02885 [Deltaproteobacteria bacterium 
MGEPIKVATNKVQAAPPSEWEQALLLQETAPSPEHCLDRYLKIVSHREKPVQKPNWVPREKLATTFPGVLFRGALIFVEEGVLIAPGVIIDTEDSFGKCGRITIKGESAIASGSVLKGEVVLVDSRLRAGSFVSGIVQLTKTTMGRSASIVGDQLLFYESLILGSVSGNAIRMNQATVTSQGMVAGSNIVVYPETVVAKAEIGSNRQLGDIKEEELSLK